MTKKDSKKWLALLFVVEKPKMTCEWIFRVRVTYTINMNAYLVVLNYHKSTIDLQFIQKF